MKKKSMPKWGWYIHRSKILYTLLAIDVVFFIIFNLLVEYDNGTRAYQIRQLVAYIILILIIFLNLSYSSTGNPLNGTSFNIMNFITYEPLYECSCELLYYFDLHSDKPIYLWKDYRMDDFEMIFRENKKDFDYIRKHYAKALVQWIYDNDVGHHGSHQRKIFWAMDKVWYLDVILFTLCGVMNKYEVRDAIAHYNNTH